MAAQDQHGGGHRNRPAFALTGEVADSARGDQGPRGVSANSGFKPARAFKSGRERAGQGVQSYARVYGPGGPGAGPTSAAFRNEGNGRVAGGERNLDAAFSVRLGTIVNDPDGDRGGPSGGSEREGRGTEEDGD